MIRRKVGEFRVTPRSHPAYATRLASVHNEELDQQGEAGDVTRAGATPPFITAKGSFAMTLKTIMQAPSLRAALFAGCVLTAGGSAHAQDVTLANSGYWSAMQLAAPVNGSPSCAIVSSVPADGRLVMVGVNSADQTLRMAFAKTSWEIPPSAKMTATVQIDGNPTWGGANGFTTNSHGMSIYIRPQGYREFIHEITSGHTITVRFSGNEPPWTFDLWGTTAVWPAFMQCAESVAPSFVAALTLPPATQPYASAPTTQPYFPAPAPQQPYVPSQPVPPPATVPQAPAPSEPYTQL